MFGSHGLPVYLPLSWQDELTANIVQAYSMSAVCTQIYVPLFIIGHYFLLVKINPIYSLSLEKRKHTSQSQRERYKQYKQYQFNIIHLITLLSLPWNCFYGFITFCFLLCVCAFVFIFLQNVTQPLQSSTGPVQNLLQSRMVNLVCLMSPIYFGMEFVLCVCCHLVSCLESNSQSLYFIFYFIYKIFFIVITIQIEISFFFLFVAAISSTCSLVSTLWQYISGCTFRKITSLFIIQMQISFHTMWLLVWLSFSGYHLFVGTVRWFLTKHMLYYSIQPFLHE